MERRAFLKGFGYSVTGLLSNTIRLSASADQRPNIIFIFSDDHAIAAIAAYPTWLQSFIKNQSITSHIDRLAQQGGLFINSFCCNSICGSSRATILTGNVYYEMIQNIAV